MHRFNQNSFYKSMFTVNTSIILLIMFMLIVSCKKRGDQTSAMCFPYGVSDKIVTRTEYPKEFGMINVRINADIEYHVLPDASMQPYVTIEGPENFVKRVDCTLNYNSHFNRNNLNLSYDRCVTRKRNPKLNIHIYGHELFQVSTYNGNFFSRDTIRSKDGFLLCELFETSSMEIVCNVPVLNLYISHSSNFISYGLSDSVLLTMITSEGNKYSKSVNLENFKYGCLYFHVPPDGITHTPTPAYAGRPDTIYYNIHTHNFNLYYQGDPVLIDRRGSPFFTLFKKG